MARLIILRLLESYFRRPFLSLLPIFFLSIVGLVFVFTKEPTYMTQGIIFVRSNIGTNDQLGIEGPQFVWDTPAEVTVNEFGELLTTESFAGAIIQSTNLVQELDDPEVDPDDLLKQVRKDIWAVPIGDNQFAIQATSEDPLIAQQQVEAAINGFINWNLTTGLSDANESVDFFADLVETTRIAHANALDDLRIFLEQNPEPVRGERPAVEQLEIDRLEALEKDAAGRYNDAFGKWEQARLTYEQRETEAYQRYVIVDSPQFPDEDQTSLLGQLMTLIIFGAIGAILAVLGIVGGALLDRTFRYPVDVRQGLELPVLGAVPAGEKFVSQHLQEMSRAVEAAPEPPRYRAKLVPNVEPPTLIVMPSEKAELERIQHERSQHEQYAPHSQERNNSYGFPGGDVGTFPDAGVHSAPVSGGRGSGSASRSEFDLANRGGVRRVRDGHSTDEGNSPYTRKDWPTP